MRTRRRFTTPTTRSIPLGIESSFCASAKTDTEDILEEILKEPLKESVTLTRNDKGAFVINEGKDSRITLVGATEAAAIAIKTAMEDGEKFFDTEKQIRNILLEEKIIVAEIENFRTDVGPVIEQRVRKLISEDQEWDSLGEKDRIDKQQEYLKQSMVNFDEETVSPAVVNALTHIVDDSPSRPSFLDDMIRDFGIANIITYSSYVGRKNPIISIPNADYRKPLEELVAAGLAYTGKDMSVEEMLSSLTLNELNYISEPEERFTRKDKAIKYLSERDDISSIINKNIAIRSLFALKPLPEKYREFNFEQFDQLLTYYGDLACIVVSVANGYSTITYFK